MSYARYTAHIGFYATPEMKEKLDKIAELEGISASEVGRELLDVDLDRRLTRARRAATKA